MAKKLENLRILAPVIAVLYSSVLSGCFLYIPEQTVRNYSPQNKSLKVNVSMNRRGVEKRYFLNVRNKKFHHRQLIRTEDFLDDSYNEIYGFSKWISPKTLRIGYSNVLGIDKVIIENESDRVIPFVLVESGFNKLLVFDLKPKGSRKLAFSVGDWISVTTVKESNSIICSARKSKRPESPSTFKINIAGANVHVESKDRILVKTECGTHDRPKDNW